MSILKNSVAIIGVSGRFPGSEDIQGFWQTLENGENHIREILPDRWNVEAFYDETGEALGKTYIRHAGMIDRAFDWDNQVFSVNDIEADKIDPQQKLALEMAFRAVENAGYTREKIKGTNTAVYIGHMNDDFPKLASFDPGYVDSNTAIGTSGSILSNRISYVFDVHGPSLTVDTACSSSLVCVDLGTKSILTGECDMAICGGVNLILYPGATICLSKAKMASRSGHCAAFSDDADGYVRGEGSGVVLIKSVEKAIKDKDKIWGYITTCCNSDGQDSVPITNPSMKRQSILIEDTVKKAGINATDIQYVEMHGTGTPVGDPVETSAVGQAYGKARQTKGLSKLLIGSVKTNIGHLESTAGIAGLVKVLLMMKYGKLAPSLFCEKESTKIDFDDLHLQVVKSLQAWPGDEKNIKCAAVNSFGFGGTNVHAIIQGVISQPKQSNIDDKEHMICFSGLSSNSVRNSLEDTLSNIKSGQIGNLQMLSETSICARDHFSFREAIIARSMEDVTQEIEKRLSSEKVGTRAIRKNTNYRTLFVFCGTGTHWEGMGQKLYQHNGAFKSAIDKIDKIFEPLAKFSIKDCLFGKKDLSNPVYGQPSIYAIQLGLVEMWKQHGIAPDAVIGHSLGEVSAAYTAGKLDLESATKVVCSRLKHLENVSGGGMLVIGNIMTEKIEEIIKDQGLEESLSIAAYNTPISCTVSGESSALKTLENSIKDQYGSNDVFLRSLPVRTAYHSKFLDPVLNDLEASLPQLKASKSAESIQHYSTVTGKSEPKETLTNKKHWVHNARKPVLFMQALDNALMKNGKNLVIEIGPKPDLKSSIRNIVKESDLDVLLLPSMMKDDHGTMFMSSLARVYEFGVNIKYPYTSTIDDFPRYGFDRKHHFKMPKNTDFLIGEMIKPIFHKMVYKDNEFSGLVCLTRVAPFTANYVYDHIFASKIIIPGAVFVESVAATCEQHNLLDFSCGDWLELSICFHKGFILKSPTSSVILKTTLVKDESSNKRLFEFDVTTPDNLHATGVVSVSSGKLEKGSCYKIKDIEKRCNEEFQMDELYDRLQVVGFQHGPLLKCVTGGRLNQMEVLASIHLEDKDLQSYVLHPVILDCVLQLVAMVPIPGASKEPVTKVPISIDKLKVFSRQAEDMVAHLYIDAVKEGEVVINAEVMNTDGEIVCLLEGIKTIIPGADYLPIRDLLYHLTWSEIPKVKNEGKTEKDVHNKTILFSNFSKKVTSSFTEAGLGHHVVAYETSTVGAILDDLDNFEQFFPNETEDFTNILYCWGCGNICDGLDDGKKISAKLGEVCYLLLQLILFVQKCHPKITINVITSHSYQILEGRPRDDKSMLCGCFGTSLWAMMRTVLKELPFLHFRCIDIAPINSEHIQCLKDIIANNTEDIEIAITPKGVLSCCVMPITPSNYTQQRLIELPQNTQISLTNDNITMMEKGGTYKYKISEMTNGVTMQMDVRSLFLPYIQKRGSQEMLGLGSICDYKGKIYHNIHPHAVCNKVEFIREFSVDSQNFPSKTPSVGLWFIAWQLKEKVMSNINKERKIRVQSLENDHVLPSIVEAVLALSGLQIETSSSDDIPSVIIAPFAEDLSCLYTDEIQGQKSAVFILTWLNNRPAIQKIFQVLKNGYIHTKQCVTIAVEEIYSESNLQMNVSLFRKWLSKCNTKHLQEYTTRMDKLISDVLPEKVYQIDGEIFQNDCIIKMPGMDEGVYVQSCPDVLFRKDCSYLVIGGSKGLGFEIVKHMASRGAGVVGIISRAGVSEEKMQELQAIEQNRQCRFLDLKANVAEYDEMEQALKDMTNSFPSKPLKGIFFGVILLDNATIPNMTQLKFSRVLQAKVVGAWNIYQLTKSIDLDYFLMHSSIASIIGSPGQSNYSAANAFTDAIACYRRNTCGVGQSICWGALEVGVLEDAEARKRIAKYGMYSLSRAEIMKALEFCLMYNPPLMMCTKLNWVLISKGIHPSSNLEKVMTKIIKRKAHFIKRKVGSVKNDKINTAKDFNDLVTQTLKTIMMLDDDEFSPSTTLDELGIDSQQVTLIYSTLVDTLGEVPFSPLDIPGLTLEELIQKLQSDGKVELEAGATGGVVIEEISDDKVQTPNENEVKNEMKMMLAVESEKNVQVLSSPKNEVVPQQMVASNDMVVLSKMYDGDYFCSSDDKDLILELRKSGNNYSLASTYKDGSSDGNLPIETISGIETTGEAEVGCDDEIEGLLIVTTKTGQRITFKSDDQSKLMMWKAGIERAISEIQKHLTQSQMNKSQQRPRQNGDVSIQKERRNGDLTTHHQRQNGDLARATGDANHPKSSTCILL